MMEMWQILAVIKNTRHSIQALRRDKKLTPEQRDRLIAKQEAEKARLLAGTDWA